MSRILIVTAFYHPFIHPRAHRWTALAEHWASLGHEVHVVTARQKGFSSNALHQGVHVHRTGFNSLKEVFYHLIGSNQARGRVGVPVRKPGMLMRALLWIYQAIWKNLYFPDDACLWYFPARAVGIRLLQTAPYDVMITVSLPFTDHLLGLTLHRRFPDLPWIADVGDPFSIQEFPLNNTWLYGRLNRNKERQVLEKANAVVVTTPATVRKYTEVFGAALTSRMEVIPPLFHPFEFPDVIPTPSNKIKIGYFGAMYRPLRTPDAFLEILDRIYRLRPDLKDRIEVHFYGEIFPDLLDQLQLRPEVHLHGLQPRATVREAMPEMDILLHLGNRSDFQLPSKAVDYLAANKPVLHLSYIQQDPFTAFWGEAEGLFVVRLDEAMDPAGLANWIIQCRQLHLKKNTTRMEKYSLGALGAAYKLWG